MKKSFLSLVLTLCLFAGSAIAQSQMLATLSHEGEISVFYGANALEDAHTAAAHGDIISLSAGNFYPVNITKAITLRGAGYTTNAQNNIYPTEIKGSFNIDIEEGVTQSLTIEGIYTESSININSSLENACFIKNRFSKFQFTNTTALCKNIYFIHCIMSNGLTAQNNSGHNSIFFINSYINYSGQRDYNSCNITFKNSIIDYSNHNSNTFPNLGYCTFYNCILIGNGSQEDINYIPLSSSAYNCIATNITPNIYSNSTYFFEKQAAGLKNWIIREKTNVFKSDGGFYELLDEVKSNYIGTDSTEIGIYGGLYPYSPITAGPQITKCNVAPRASADGKLSIEIEVKAGK